MIYSPGRSLHSRDNLKFGIDYCSFKQIGRKRLLLSPSILKFWVRNISAWSKVFLFIIHPSGLQYRILCALMWTEHNQTKINYSNWKLICEGHTLTVLWMTLALFLGLWGSLDPLKARKSSSFSLFDRAIANFGQMDPSLPDEEPFLSSGRVCGTPLLLLPLPGRSLSGEATVWMPLFCCCCAGDFMVANSSEFLQIQKQHID